MSDLNAAIDAEVIAHLRGQAEAHLAIAAALEKHSRPRNARGAYTALQRAAVHAEIADKYKVLIGLVDSGLLGWVEAGEQLAETAGAR